MASRSKPPDRVCAETHDDVLRHHTLDVVMVDNIMDMDYIGTLLPRLASTDWDLRIHYEVKSNLRRDDGNAFAAARVAHIPPGIVSPPRPRPNIMPPRLH